MIKIRPVFQSGIDIVWPLVLEGLSTIDRKCGPEDPPELIRQWLKTAPFIMLYLVYSGKEYVGFFIAKIDTRIHHQEFCIYKAYKIDSHFDLFTVDLWDQIKGLALVNKCSRVTFYSTRKGWEKKAKSYGFSKGYTQYIMDIQEA